MMNSYHQFIEKISEVESKGLPFVVFKLPNQSELHFIYQNDTKLYTEIDFSQKGFLMNSFLQDKSVFIPKQNHFVTSFENNKFNNIQAEIKSGQDKKNHINLVEKAIKSIKEDEFKKVVLSRRVFISKEMNSLTVYFERLIALYPTAFCYVFSHPKVGKWLAATPEILFTIEQGDFTTMSLAGTLPFKGENPIWSEKEKEEQQVVTDTIAKILQKYVQSLNLAPIRNLRAGNLWHLCTKISGKISLEVNIQNLINELHPTPAVCGYPTNAAHKFIVDNEQYPREFYTGYCGILNFFQKDDISMFVNLRCAQILERGAYIYAGGGITSESNALSEWEETQQKLLTMFNILA